MTDTTHGRAIQRVFEAAKNVAAPRAARASSARGHAPQAEDGTKPQTQEAAPGAQETAPYVDPGRAGDEPADSQHVENVQAAADLEAAVSPAVRDVILRRLRQGTRAAAAQAAPVASWAQQLQEEINRGEVWRDDQAAEVEPVEVEANGEKR